MAKKNKNPEVRFKSFTEDWKHQELGEVLTERKSMQKISEDAPILAFASGQGVIDRSERKSNNRDHLTLDQENKVYKLTELNDIVYNPSNLKYGAIDRNKHGRGVISPIYVTFTTEEEASFIELIVKSEKFKLRALQYEEGTVVKRQSVSPENLLSLKINLSPSLDEQKNIGKLFKKLDILISQHQIKYDKFIILKKAMLGKMFPKKGSKDPELRFNHFKGQWKLVKLTELADFNPKSELPNQFKYVDLESVTGTKMTGYKKLNKSNAPSRAQRLARQGDLFYQTVRPYQKNNYVFDRLDKDFVFSTGYAQLRPNIDSNFLLSLVQNNCVVQSVMIRCTGTSYPAINSNDLSEIEVFFPEDPLEQNQIGIFFKNLDYLIDLHLLKIKKLQDIKKSCSDKMLT